ncbi:MAG: DUF6265 family protein [Pseudomonadota bacterium]
MSKLTRVIILPAALCSFGVAAVSFASPTPALAGDLDWLEGCWVTQSGETREVWARGAETLLFGYNVASKDGAVGFFEQLRLEKREDGWAYFAYPRGESPTRFNETIAGRAWIEFRNPSHDFPQRIRYALEGDVLRAEISLADGEDARAWLYASCND